jgi:hypothetical protein
VSLDRDQIDRALADWQTRAARVKSNLQVLEDSPTFSMVQRGLILTGRSKTDVVDPIRAAGELADYCVILEGQVARAVELRASLRAFLPSEDTLREIDRLLNGASVPLAAPQVPLAQRNLLDDPGQSQITLNQLVDVMTAAFTAARDAVTRYDAAIQRLKPALDAADTDLRELEARARELGVAADTRLAPVRAAVAQARQQVLDDPLGAADTFALRVDGQLAALGQQMAVLAQERDGALAELARAHDRQRRAERHFAPAQTNDLAMWLAAIDGAVAAGKYASARVGLQRWSEAATEAYGSREQRDEQLDLLRALRVKAQSLRARGVTLPPDVDALALQAEGLLRLQSPNVPAAQVLLEQYRRALAAIR